MVIHTCLFDDQWSNFTFPGMEFWVWIAWGSLFLGRVKGKKEKEKWRKREMGKEGEKKKKKKGNKRRGERGMVQWIGRCCWEMGMKK